ncbi:MAG: ACT domain-containing protein [Pseudomonadota bacterium]
MRFQFPKRPPERAAPTGDVASECIVLTASGEDRPGLLEGLSGKIADSGCSIEECRVAVLGGRFTMSALLSGPWHALSRLEPQLPGLGEQLGLALTHVRTPQRSEPQQAIPYNVELVTLDRPGIVHQLAVFFARKGINIEELNTTTYPAAHTGANMFSMLMTVGVPPDQHIATLRGDFLDYCDALNLDATFEPMRS